MRWQSSAIRIAYNVLKQNKHTKEIYENLKKLFPILPTRYIPSAIIKASQYPTDKPLIFGGKALFEKLCKNHLSGRQREKLKQKWKERRQGTLISIGTGNKIEKGNRLLRFERLNGELYLRITTGKREWVYAKVLRELSKVALLFPILGRSFVRDFSPLKLLLVQGMWDGVRDRASPFRGWRDENIFENSLKDLFSSRFLKTH